MDTPNIWFFTSTPQPSRLGDACFHIIRLQEQAKACETCTALTEPTGKFGPSRPVWTVLKSILETSNSGPFIVISWERDIGKPSNQLFWGGKCQGGGIRTVALHPDLSVSSVAQ